MTGQQPDLWMSLYRGRKLSGISVYRLLGLISAGALRAQRVAGRTVILARDLEELAVQERAGDRPHLRGNAATSTLPLVADRDNSDRHASSRPPSSRG
jgi:hypothetical protein